MTRVLIVATSLAAVVPLPVDAQELTANRVLESIRLGQRMIVSLQNPNGSWRSESQDKHVIGVTSLAVLALINSGMTVNDTPVKRGVEFLRRENGADQTYDVALQIMALAAVRDPLRTDGARIESLARWLEKAQVTNGELPGGWTYGNRGIGPDPSNSQFAILGLREAAEAGVQVNRQVVENARIYWENRQNADGGWAYGSGGGGGGGSTGSMTVAGVASLAICQQMLRTDDGVAADGTPPCCRPEDPYPALERGLNWLGEHFSPGNNPNSGTWPLYYLYGVERAGRLSGRRFFGNHDWYREGAAFLVAVQIRRDSGWKGIGLFEFEENKSVVGTSLALLFLSKGLAPVLMTKLKHGPRDRANPKEIVGQDWNHHPRDVRNLMEHISGLPRWPALLTSQELDLKKAADTTGVDALLQAPMLFLTGSETLQFAPEEIALLKEYLAQGGFLFACPSCQSAKFEASFRELMKKLVPEQEAELKLLPEDHPVYRSEYLLSSPKDTPLYGVDVGCRTSVIYSPEDLACLWSYWQRHDPPKRNQQLKFRVDRSLRIAVNVAAYATGREPPKSLDAPKKLAADTQLDEIQRGLLQVAQLKHTGQWNAAPRALRYLLLALNETVGLSASTKPREVSISDPNLFQYPLLYMHGRTKFAMGQEEQAALKLHFSRGGVLFADACCGAKPFDKSFREMVAQLYPDKKLHVIPVTHELFSDKIGRDIRRLRRRTAEAAAPNGPPGSTIKEVEPLLEGIEIDGRYVIIYSKYDISCALERQSTLNCEGYVPEDAVKLAINIVLYALLQDVALPKATP